MLSVLKEQVTNLDSSKYKVMLVWDPDNARDIGWLTVEKDIKVELEAMQVRDVNLNKITVITSKSESKYLNQNNEREGNAVVSSVSSSLEEHSQEVIVIDDDDIEDNVGESQDTKPKVVGKVDLRLGRQFKVKCSECQAIVSSSYLLQHMARVHGQFIKTEKAKCSTCGISVNKVNLEFHMKLKHGVAKDSQQSTDDSNDSNLTNCIDCGKSFKSEKCLSSHRRWCIKASKDSKKKEEFKILSASTERNSPEKEGVVAPPTNPLIDSERINQSKNERVNFSILHESKSYNCSRSKGAQIKGSLKKFCKHVGQDLKFEFEGRFLTGAEIVDTFSGVKILSSATT